MGSHPGCGTLSSISRNTPKTGVPAVKLARAVYPNDSDAAAEKRLYGVLRHLTGPTYEYGHVHWFFKADRERNPDGSLGGMVYIMSETVAAWIKEASERE